MNFTNLREEARKMGGEEAVAALDEGRGWEMEADKRITAIVDEMVAAHGEHRHRRLIHVALSEALSKAMTAAVYNACYTDNDTGEMKHPDRIGEALAMAAMSLNGNLERHMETEKAKASGVFDKIMSAIKGVKP